MALRNNTARKVAHSLHGPIILYIKVVLHFSLQPPICRKRNGESNFTTKYKTHAQIRTCGETPGPSGGKARKGDGVKHDLQGLHAVPTSAAKVKLPTIYYLYTTYYLRPTTSYLAPANSCLLPTTYLLPTSTTYYLLSTTLAYTLHTPCCRLLIRFNPTHLCPHLSSPPLTHPGLSKLLFSLRAKIPKENLLAPPPPPGPHPRRSLISFVKLMPKPGNSGALVSRALVCTFNWAVSVCAANPPRH